MWQLLSEAYARVGTLPTLLERDFNLPPLESLLGEVARIRRIQAQAETGRAQAVG